VSTCKGAVQILIQIQERLLRCDFFLFIWQMPLNSGNVDIHIWIPYLILELTSRPTVLMIGSGLMSDSECISSELFSMYVVVSISDVVVVNIMAVVVSGSGSG
jgi:hypothetical protein